METIISIMKRSETWVVIHGEGIVPSMVKQRRLLKEMY